MLLSTIPVYTVMILTPVQNVYTYRHKRIRQIANDIKHLQAGIGHALCSGMINLTLTPEQLEILKKTIIDGLLYNVMKYNDFIEKDPSCKESFTKRKDDTIKQIYSVLDTLPESK